MLNEAFLDSTAFLTSKISLLQEGLEQPIVSDLSNEEINPDVFSHQNLDWLTRQASDNSMNLSVANEIVAPESRATADILTGQESGKANLPSDIPLEVTAQEFLDFYSGRTISEGITVKIQDGTAGKFQGDFIVNLQGEIEFGENVSIDVSGLFKLDGESLEEESPPGSQLEFGENNVMSAATIEWGVNSNFQVKMNSSITAQHGNLIIEAGSQIQLEENISLQALEGSIKLDAIEDGGVQIKKVESAILVPNISARKDITFMAGGDIQILEGNIIHAGGNLTLMGTSEEGDIEVAPPNSALFPHSLEAGGDIHMETNGDIQIQEGNTLKAGNDLTLIAKSEGDVQIQQIDFLPLAPRLEAGEDIVIKAEGDINIQRGDSVGAFPFPDFKAGNDIFMQGLGEVEIEPGNWLKAERTIHLETDGVEVQVQPRANVTLEAGLDIFLFAPEENAGIKVGENSTLKARRNIILISGLNDQGEGDTQIKENSTLIAGNRIAIKSGLSGQTEVKENSRLIAKDSITIESGERGKTVVKGDGTLLNAIVVTVKTGLNGECVIEPDVEILAAARNICEKAFI
jgi:hypothetical protein